MIYYFIFCITTMLVSIIMCKLPVVRECRPDLLGNITFWTVVAFADFIMAPILFFEVIFLPETLKATIRQNLET